MQIRNVIVLSTLMAVLLSVDVNAGLGPGGPGPRGGPGGPRPVFGPARPGPMRPPVGSRRIVIGGVPYWVHGGVYYRHDHDDTYVIVTVSAVATLPGPYTVVVVGGVAYYVVDGVYYQAAPGGYVIVDRPVQTVVVHSETPAPVVPASPTRVLYVPKTTGDGFVPVTLQKIEGGYLGPQGEFYPTMPEVVLLTEMYGVPEELRQTRTDVFFIHIPNKNGSGFTRVTLTRRDNGFVGPKGEFYPLMPTVAHLVELYGAAATPAQAEGTVLKVQVARKNGVGFVEIELKRHQQGYLGPQGEFYPEMPAGDQLTELYGGE